MMDKVFDAFEIGGGTLLQCTVVPVHVMVFPVCCCRDLYLVFELVFLLVLVSVLLLVLVYVLPLVLMFRNV